MPKLSSPSFVKLAKLAKLARLVMDSISGQGLTRKFMDPTPDLVRAWKWPRLDAQWSDADLASAAMINALCLENCYRVGSPPRVLQSLSLLEALDLHVYDVSFPCNDDVRSELHPIVLLWFALRDLE